MKLFENNGGDNQLNEQVERLLELPQSQKIGILAGTLVLLLAIYYFMFFSGQADQLSKLKDSIYGNNGLTSQIEREERIAVNLPKFEKQVKDLDQELRRALLELPDKKEIDDLLARVSNEAREAGLEIQLFKPMPEGKRDFYAEVPVDVEVVGTYHQLGAFFDEVGHLERIVNLDHYQVSDPKIADGNMLLTTKVVATAFRFLDEDERPQQEEDKKKHRRKKAPSKNAD